jgi:hypothetical protein
MFYIPKDWIKDKNNESIVHKILNENIYTDLNVDNNIKLVIQKLNDIGETIIVEKIKNGTIIVN